jgi:hypothetical protein
VPGHPEAPQPLVQSDWAAESLRLIANVVKIITQKTKLALKLCVLDLVPERRTAFY